MPFVRPQGPPPDTLWLVRAVLRRRFMGGNLFRTAHKRMKPTDCRTPAATAPPFHVPAQRSAYARLFQRCPGMNRLRKCPAYAGVLRLRDAGWTRAGTFPPEPPLVFLFRGPKENPKKC
jgi:hypothetical protein